MPQAAQLREIAEMPEGSPAPAAASAPWAFAILVVGTSLDSRAPSLLGTSSDPVFFQRIFSMQP